MALDFNTDDLAKELLAYAKDCKEKFDLYVNTSAQQMEAYAKQNRPWKDRSARARQGLKGSATEEDGVYTISAEVFGDGIDMWLRSQGDRVNIMRE